MPLDLGCGWLHSADRNPWVAVAETEGFPVDRTPSAWGRQFADLGFSAAEQAEAWQAFQDFNRTLGEKPPASDRAVDALKPGSGWNAFLEALSSYMNGAALDQLSVADYLAYDTAATRTNWRIAEGYGTLIAAAGRDLPVRLSTPVTSIDRRTSPLVMATAGGLIEARSAIVAVPTSVLARNVLRFIPALDDKVEAAAALPLGLADKLFLSLDGAEEIDADQHLLGSPRRAETGSYYLRPFGRPLIEAFFGGTAARQLEREGVAGMTAFAIEELVELFGSSMRRRLHPVIGSRWGETEWIWGSYSHACPGHSAARSVLAEPIEHRIVFAGEACSLSDFSTAHGAFESGDAAARTVIELLNPGRGTDRLDSKMGAR
jgi:monoamine oxidase